MVTLTRETRETKVRVRLGAPTPAISTGDAFLDHMLAALSRYADLDLDVDATGDLRHHLVEDVAITIGTLLRRETPATCARYGHAVVPMDDALVDVTIDIGGRAYHDGRMPGRLYEHFFRSLASEAGWTLHVRILRGRDRHHMIEAAFKALGLALRQARRDDGTVFSTKGAVRLSWEES